MCAAADQVHSGSGTLAEGTSSLTGALLLLLLLPLAGCLDGRECFTRAGMKSDSSSTMSTARRPRPSRPCPLLGLTRCPLLPFPFFFDGVSSPSSSSSPSRRQQQQQRKLPSPAAWPFSWPGGAASAARTAGTRPAPSSGGLKNPPQRGSDSSRIRGARHRRPGLGLEAAAP